MICVACSGFPVATSRYFREFMAVEIAQTELGIPGEGTLRRWLREAPEGFGFSVLAPTSIAESGFALDKAATEVVKSIGQFATSLGAHAIVFKAGPGFAMTRSNRTRVRKFAEGVPKLLAARGPSPVLDLEAWPLADVLGTIKDARLSVAFDPSKEQPSGSKPAGKLSDKLLYLRMPGPSGHRSRYKDGDVDQAMGYTTRCKAKTTFVVFRNIDMYVNARRAMGQL